MRLDRAIVMVAVVILIGWGLGATDDPVKIGMVDIELAWSSTDDGKGAMDQLQKAVREAEAKMRPKMEHFEQLKREMQEMQHVLSKEAMQKRQFDLVELKGTIENESAGIDQQLKLEQARLMQPLQEKLQRVVDEIGRTQGFSLILVRGTPGIIYSREALDITDLVVEAFNKKSKKS